MPGRQTAKTEQTIEANIFAQRHFSKIHKNIKSYKEIVREK